MAVPNLITHSLILSFFTLLLPVCIKAQEYAYRTFTIYDGLVQMQVLDVFQDSRGYLWIGTKVGVSKFDGERFENFNVEDGLADFYVNDILEDARGNIWFCTRRGLTKWDGKTMTSYPYDFKYHSSFALDNEGKIWIYNSSMIGLLTFDGAHYATVDSSKSTYGFVYFSKPQQKLFCYSKIEKYLYEVNTGIKSKINFDSIKIYHSQNIGDRHYLHLEYQDGQHVLYEDLPTGFVELAAWKDNTLFFSQLHEDYHFFEGKDLMKLEASTGKLIKIQTFDFPLPTLNLIDKQGFIWIGTDEGLIQYFGEGFQNYNQPEFRFVWNFIEDDEGVLWYARYRAGLYRYDGKTITEVKDYLPLTDGHKDFYYGARKDKRGNLWFPHTHGVLVLEKSGKWRLIPRAAGEGTHTYLFYDEGRDVMVAGLAGGFKIIQPDGQYRYLSISDGLHQTPYYNVIAEDKNAHYWLGSDDGVARYTPEEDSIYNYTHENGRLPVRGIISLYRDYRGTMWLGSTKGLFHYDYETDSILKVSTTAMQEHIQFITGIDTTHLLIGVYSGLYVFDLQAYYASQDVRLNFFNRNNGYMGIEPRINDAYTDKEGNIWVGSSSITVKINPDKLRLENIPPITYITAVNGKKVGLAKDTVSYELPYGENNATISFEAVGFSRSLKTKYRYRLDNADTWSDWQEEPYLFISNLSSGKHTLQVLSQSIGSEDQSIRPATLILIVKLPFWKESNFPYFIMAFLGITILAVIWIAYIAWWNKLRAREKEQEVNYLRVQTLQAQMNPHFIFNVLGTLQNLILMGDSSAANQHLVNLSILIRRFLDSSIGSEMPKNFASESEISLEKEIELIKMYVSFEKLQFSDNFDYKISIDEHLEMSNISIPPMIIQPYIENAIKHGLRYKKGKGHLWIRFYQEKEYLICEVEDDGVGREKAKEIQQKSLRMYKSRGTDLVKQRINVLNEMGYDIQIDSYDREGGGTIVHIKISLQL